MHNITVVTLGPGAREHLTLGTVDALRQAGRIVLRTKRHGAAGYLAEQGLPFVTLDSLYDASEDFDTLALRAAQEVLRMAAAGPLCYGVADPGNDESVRRLLHMAADNVVILPGVTLEAPLLAARPTEKPLLMTDAAGLTVLDGQRPLCITEIDSQALAGTCKLQLMEHYDPDCTLYFFPPGEGGKRQMTRTTLEELDRQPRYDHTCGALLLPGKPFEKERYDLQDVVNLMAHLRAPGGCPWDRAQTHRSLARYLVEEANEAAHAIAQEDWEAVADELGDVLLQVVFHASVGEEYGTMTLGDITTAICRKMIKRHTHIFGGQALDTPEQVSDSWEKIKAKERGNQTPAQKMRSLPASLPPLLRALKVQEAAAKVGFDWPDAHGALDKVHEEANELLAELDAGRDTRDELGDLFFAAVNAARLMDTYPDEVVNIATEKFINRFEHMENAIKMDQKPFKCLTLEDWDVYWVRSKQADESLALLKTQEETT